MPKLKITVERTSNKEKFWRGKSASSPAASVGDISQIVTAHSNIVVIDTYISNFNYSGTYNISRHSDRYTVSSTQYILKIS